MNVIQRLIHYMQKTQPPDLWITNYNDRRFLPVGEIWMGAYGACCISCGKKMSRIWETVCYACGDTSCYDHSIAVEGHWYCLKDDPSAELEFRQSFPGWSREEAACFREEEGE